MLVAAGVLAGAIGAPGGVTSLVSYPALSPAACRRCPATLVDDRLPEANAVKNMLLGVGAVVSALVFTLLRPVDWPLVAPLAAGMFAGSAAGPVLARLTPPVVVRGVVGLLGLALAAMLWWRG
jgi:uncharacterized membrane protein YfcA